MYSKKKKLYLDIFKKVLLINNNNNVLFVLCNYRRRIYRIIKKYCLLFWNKNTAAIFCSG